MLRHTDILLDENYELEIGQNGDFTTGDSVMQEVDIIVQLNRGQLKHTPLLGPGLIRLVNTPINDSKLRALLRLHLAMDGKNLAEIKELIHLKKIN